MSDDSKTGKPPGNTTTTPLTSAAAPNPAPTKAKKPADNFGDPSLSGPFLDPIPANARNRRFSRELRVVLGLVLMPQSLALLAVIRPAAASGRGALLATAAAVIAAAAVTAFSGMILSRFGISPGVWLRPMLGTHGAKFFSALRGLCVAAFFGQAAFLSAQLLRWGVLCLQPAWVVYDKHIPSYAGISALTAALTMIIAAIAWARPRANGVFLPGLLLAVVLAVLPGNGSSHILLDGAPMTSALTAPFFVAFAWATALLVTALDGARHAQKPSTEVGAVLTGGAAPWLLGAAAYALATLHDSPASRFWDLSEVACARLSAAWLVPVTLLAGIAAIFPLAAPAQAALRTSIAEVFPRAKKSTRLEAMVVVCALVAAIIARSDGGGNVFFAELGLATFVAGAFTVAVLDFALVRRGKIYFDDLYSARGAYRGVFGFSPSGWMALFGGVAVFFATRFLGPNHLSATFAAATGAATWLLGQLVLGNIEHAIRERK